MRVKWTIEDKRNYDKNWRTNNPKSPRFWIRKYKESFPCMDCKQFYPACVMDFDHLRDKIADVNRIVRSSSLGNLQEEIKKCELVCSNCHRIRTFKRKNNMSLA